MGHSGPVHGVAFSPDGTQALTGGADRTVRLWDVATGKELREYAGQEDLVRGVAFSPDGRFILSASHDHTAWLWPIDAGTVVP